ncbi:MAG: hypothetical protein Q8P80_01065 [Candidatus Levybacteria bacterium]|nr:hypothetical protein [Candidatus Levybacteria bacterium]
MEIIALSVDSIKIKGKNTSVVVDPRLIKSKTEADAIVLLNENQDYDLSKIENQRLLIKGPGEYEFGGIKISGLSCGDDIVYEMLIDGLKIILGKAESIEKIKDKVGEHEVAVLKISSQFDQNLITAIEPRVAVFYGEKAQEVDSNLKPVLKFATKSDKLPEELEKVILVASN